MKAEWATVENLKYSAVLGIKGFDQIGLINKITRLISNEMNVNISSINIKSNNGIFNGVISVIVINKVHLENLINKLESIDGVESIERL
jgi:GTP pyrophosphokinase